MVLILRCLMCLKTETKFIKVNIVVGKCFGLKLPCIMLGWIKLLLFVSSVFLLVLWLWYFLWFLTNWLWNLILVLTVLWLILILGLLLLILCWLLLWFSIHFILMWKIQRLTMFIIVLLPFWVWLFCSLSVLQFISQSLYLWEIQLLKTKMIVKQWDKLLQLV